MNVAFEFRRLSRVEEMLPHWGLLTQLSPGLTKEAYEERLREMVTHNYRQVGVFEAERCIAVSGYWIGFKLYSGKYLEIDNFVVDKAHRSAGIGGLLVEWLEAEARAQECTLMMLDAYVENFRGHRFYYRHASMHGVSTT